jgi:hypothetical protein
MTVAHPLDLAWGTLTAAEQRMHAAAEARAYYRWPCPEYQGGHHDQQRNATRDELIEALGDDVVDDICPPLPGRPKGDAA